MEIRLLAFESMGVRSMATYIQTRDAAILIDPSAALAPRRFGLPPHIIEAQRLLEAFRVIEEFARDSNIVIVTHYHYDHHDPGKYMDLEVLRGKKLFIKDPENNINFSQRRRAKRFLSKVKGIVTSIENADSREIFVGRTRIVFSEPQPHGENPRLGYVLQICIDDGEDRVLYTSDIEGAPLDVHIEFFYRCRPRIAIVDGPPTYLEGFRYSIDSIKRCVENLAHIVSTLNELEIMVLDHHLARDPSYRDRISKIIQVAIEKGKRVVLASEFMGVETLLLEASRRELYEKDPRSGVELLKAAKRHTVEEHDEEE